MSEVQSPFESPFDQWAVMQMMADNITSREVALMRRAWEAASQRTEQQAGAAEPKGMREALEDAARSLETISKLAGGTEYMLSLLQVRGYAGSRALDARAALAADQKETP